MGGFVIVGAIDPGADSPGYAVFDSDAGAFTWINDFPPAMACDAWVVESGWIGKMGRQAMWGLGFNAAWRLMQASQLSPAPKRFTIRPDGLNGWRAALPIRANGHTKLDGLPKSVIVARLRVRYAAALAGGATDDMVEAMGIAEAAAAILARPRAAERKALKPVRFT